MAGRLKGKIAVVTASRLAFTGLASPFAGAAAFTDDAARAIIAFSKTQRVPRAIHNLLTYRCRHSNTEGPQFIAIRLYFGGGKLSLADCVVMMEQSR